MIGAPFWAGTISGVPIGAGVVGLIWFYIHHKVNSSDEPADVVSEADHAALTGQFRTHAEAMAQQVSQYADALADGDLVLRERLRRFERGAS